MYKSIAIILFAACCFAAAAIPARLKLAELREAQDMQTMGILYTEVPMSNLVRRCFQQIPLRYRERCLFDSYERFVNSVFPMKSRCCTKWYQIECLQKYAFNSIYCDLHERTAVTRYFDKIRSLAADGSPECDAYRPVAEEKALWSSNLGRVPKCSTPGNEPM